MDEIGFGDKRGWQICISEGFQEGDESFFVRGAELDSLEGMFGEVGEEGLALGYSSKALLQDGGMRRASDSVSPVERRTLKRSGSRFLAAFSRAVR